MQTWIVNSRNHQRNSDKTKNKGGMKQFRSTRRQSSSTIPMENLLSKNTKQTANKKRTPKKVTKEGKHEKCKRTLNDIRKIVILMNNEHHKLTYL